MTSSVRARLVSALVVCLLVGWTSFAAAQATATLAGTVKDAQGGIIPGATVTLISESRGTTFETVTGVTGDFVVPNVPGDTYTIRVAMDGFKTTDRKGVSATAGDRVAVGTLVIEVGTLAETVLVTGDAPVIQAQTGDRSFVVSRESVENLPVAGRNFASFASLAPGVQGTTRLDGARTNFVLDGVSTVNTGGNQQGIQLSGDAIAEVKVIASAYQAEYGRSAGLQISGVTKSGSNQFRGSVYDIERNSDWNSNSWANVRNLNPKNVAKQRDWGYTIGGPVGHPGGKNKLFFFYSEQFSPRSSGGNVNHFRVPTLLERQGDFSQSTDNTGAVFNLIRDSSTGLPCTAANTSGCFQDGGVVGRIPQNRLYSVGLAILRQYPVPNVDGLNYNLDTTAPTVSQNLFQHVIRVDYQMSSKLRISAKYAGQNETVQPTIGSMPGFNDTLFKFPAILVPSATVDYTFNSSTVFEGTWGLTQGNQLGNVPISPNSNRCIAGFCDLPLLFPDAGIAPQGSYQYKLLKAAGAPMLVNGVALATPAFSWGGRIANAPPNNNYPNFMCMQNTKDLALSITKLWGGHTFKAGYQSQDSMKLQNLGVAGAGPFWGQLSFANDSNNPLDTGFGYSNAALGIFNSFRQANHLLEGRYLYHNKDAYIQDNWKVTSKLTMDVGMRFTHHGPQYDADLQSSNFFSDKWSASKAPLLYVPGCSTAIPAAGCATANRVAVNPITGASLGAGTAVAIGTIVANSGVVANGIIQAGHGIAKENYVEPGLAYGPRIGGAYDLTGLQRTVIRGSVGLFYDRIEGGSIFDQIGNPPTAQGSTVFNSTLQSVAAGALGTQAPPALAIYYYDAKIPASVNWNLGVQMVMPWSSSLDVSYVGSHNYNSISFAQNVSVPAGQVAMDLNAPDLGAAYLPQNQDPTLAPSLIPGATAVTTDLLRPYRGLGAITTTWPLFHTQYDSLQTSFNRRFRKGWQAGVNWTLGLRNVGNRLSPIHFKHNSDGSFAPDASQDATDAIVSNAGIRRHVVKANFVWDLPDVSATGGVSKVVAAAANGWQVSGVFTAGSGTQYDATYSYQTNGASVNLTGSPNYPARIRILGDTGSGCSSDQYRQFDASAYAGPTYGSIGNESGVNLLTGCPDHTLDLSIARNLTAGGGRQVQFRLDLFNALNSVVFNARASALQYNTPADPTTLRNSQFNADGSLNTARLQPNNAGAGAVTGAQALRTVQAQLRFTF